jgi:hypothetical protein
LVELELSEDDDEDFFSDEPLELEPLSEEESDPEPFEVLLLLLASVE